MALFCRRNCRIIFYLFTFIIISIALVRLYFTGSVFGASTVDDPNGAQHWWELCPATLGSMIASDSEELDKHDRADVMSTLPDFKGMRVIDVGSGIGRFTAPLANRAKRVLSVDFVQAFVDLNRQRHSHLTNVEYLRASAVDLNFEPDSWDLVFASWTMTTLKDEDAVDLMTKALVWLSPNGIFFFREACKIQPVTYDAVIDWLWSMRKTAYQFITSNLSFSKLWTYVTDDPQHYRSFCQYFALIEKIRVKDERTGRYMRFELTWMKQSEGFQAVEVFGTVHTILRKVWLDQNETSPPLSRHDMLQEFTAVPLQKKERFVKEIEAREAVWNAHSPFQSLFSKILEKQMVSIQRKNILILAFDLEAAISGSIFDYETDSDIFVMYSDAYMYDYNLVTTDNPLLHLRWIADPNQADWHLPTRSFDLIIACHLSTHVTNMKRVLENIKFSLAKKGKVILLEKVQGNENVLAKNGFPHTFTSVDFTKEVRKELGQAVSDIQHKEELQSLRETYQTWLNSGDASTNWYILTASDGFMT